MGRMERNVAMRCTLWRFGVAIVAVYALVLQSILIPAAPVAARAFGEPAFPLCNPSRTPAQGYTAPLPG